MFHFLPPTLKGCILVSLYFINTFVCVIPIFIIAMFKLAIPSEAWRDTCSRALKKIAETWVGVNKFTTRLFCGITWEVEGLEGLQSDSWCLVVANHQSWADILALQTIFYKKIPFLKFFLKENLIYVPFLGFAWWALDFPFMKRYSKEFLAKNPHLAGKDLETTRTACARFSKFPVSVMNFVEGTRFTPEKHKRQDSPHTHLLRPKAGGVGFVLGAMGGVLTSLVNVTITYPHGKKSFWDFMCGQVDLVRVHIETVPITEELIGDYFNDAEYRDRFQVWLNALWEAKDARIAAMLEGRAN
jgi:1-acyl-sn-glycerol-3-phosphate acyltransferase